MGKGVLFCFVLVIILSTTVFADVDITDCQSVFGNLMESGSLSSDLNCDGTGIKVDPLVNDITINCNDHTISCSGSSCDEKSGIFLPSNVGVTIENCVVEGFARGVSVGTNSSQSATSGEHIIQNNVLNENIIGIAINRPEGYLFDSNNNVIQDNIITDSEEYGVYLRVAGGNLLIGNIITGDGDAYGVGLNSVDEVTIEENIFSDLRRGVDSDDSEEIDISLNEFIDVDYGLFLSDTNIVLVDSNSFNQSENFVIDASDSDELTITNNQAVDVNSGIILFGSLGSVISENYFVGLSSESEGSFGIGLWDQILFGSDSVEDISVNSNYFSGFKYAGHIATNGSGNNFESNYFCGSSTYDFYCMEVGEDSAGSNNFMDTINSCQIIDCETDLSESGNYYLSEDVQCYGTDGVYISGDDVTLDCQGNSIIGDDTSGTKGIYVTGDNFVVENCFIEDFYYGLHAESDSSSSSTTVKNGEIRNSEFNSCVTHSVRTESYNINIENVMADANFWFIGNIFLGGVDIFISDASACTSSSYDVGFANGGNSVIIEDSYFDNIYDVFLVDFDPSGISSCSSAPSSIDMDIGTEDPGFPIDVFTNTYTCIEADACGDSQDNDADGLIDCADSDCDMKSCGSTDGYACIEGACIEVVLEEAQQATVQIETAYIGYLWSYTDLFDWLNSATVYHEEGVCDEICGSYSQTCLFADAGRSLCSDEDSEKCTCV